MLIHQAFYFVIFTAIEFVQFEDLIRAVKAGGELSPQYDYMISKYIVINLLNGERVTPWLEMTRSIGDFSFKRNKDTGVVDHGGNSPGSAQPDIHVYPPGKLKYCTTYTHAQRTYNIIYSLFYF